LLMNPQDESAAGQIIEGANSSLAEYQRMSCWMVWPEPDFPRTPSGKPKLAVIADVTSRFLRGQQKEWSSAGGIAELLAKFTDPGSDGEHLERALSLTSLDRVELMSALEQRYQVELSETAFVKAKTVGDVERLLREPSLRGGQSAQGAAATGRREFAYPRWTQSWPICWVRIAVYYALVWPVTQILAHPKIVGRENLRGVRVPVLIVSNHVTRRADVGLILAALPMRFRHRLATAIGGETLQEMRWPPREWFFGKRWAYQAGYWLVIALFNVFPLPRFSGFRTSFRFAGDSVDRGNSVLVFPEGVSNDTETGEMNKFHSGIGLLAENLGLPIVPMRMDGVWKMRLEGRRLARLGEITLRIGKPVTFPAGTPPEEIAAALQSRVKEL
jgi:long-chain acyl-CoA synthetase